MRHRIFGIEQVTVTTRKTKEKKKKSVERMSETEAVFFQRGDKWLRLNPLRGHRYELIFTAFYVL